MDVDRLPVDNGSASYRAAVARQTLVHPWGWPIVGFPPQASAINAIDERIAGTTQSRRTFCYGIEHRLKIGRRTSEHPQDIANRGELFQRFVALPLELLNYLRLLGLRLFREATGRLRLGFLGSFLGGGRHKVKPS